MDYSCSVQRAMTWNIILLGGEVPIRTDQWLIYTIILLLCIWAVGKTFSTHTQYKFCEGGR